MPLFRRDGIARCGTFIFFIALFIIVPRCSAKIIKTTFDITDSNIVLFARFGFLQGGYFTLSGHIGTNDKAYIFAATPAQLQALVDQSSSRCEDLLPQRSKYGDIWVPLPLEKPVWTSNATARAYYSFILVSRTCCGARYKCSPCGDCCQLDCDRETITGTIEAVFMNPGGEHLDAGYIALPMYYLVVCISPGRHRWTPTLFAACNPPRCGAVLFRLSCLWRGRWARTLSPRPHTSEAPLLFACSLSPPPPASAAAGRAVGRGHVRVWVARRALVPLPPHRRPPVGRRSVARDQGHLCPPAANACLPPCHPLSLLTCPLSHVCCLCCRIGVPSAVFLLRAAHEIFTRAAPKTLCPHHIPPEGLGLVWSE